MTVKTWTNGLRKGFGTAWELGKIIFPITLILSILQHTPVIDWFVHLFAPIMGWFGLPGDASVVLVLGNLLNIYAGIGSMLTMDLTVKEVFILSVMLSFSHNLLLETAITSKIGVKAWVVATVRLGLAFLSAFLIHLFWKGGQEPAQYGLVPKEPEQMDGWADILLYGVETAAIGALQIAAIVIPLMVGIEILKDINALRFFAKGLSPFTRLIGVSQNSTVTLMAGLIFGIAFGAGVIIQAAKEDNLSKKDLYLISLFLITCHAVIEDTLIFIPLGINVFYLFLIRLLTAIVFTALTARVWLKLESKNKALSSAG